MKRIKLFENFNDDEDKIKNLLFSPDESNRKLGITLYKNNPEYHSEEMDIAVWIMEHLIFVFAKTTAIIDSEFVFFKDCYKKLVNDNKELENKDIFVFLNVDATFSSGSNLFYVKDGKPYEAADDCWDFFYKLFESLNLSTVDDVKKDKSLKSYVVYL